MKLSSNQLKSIYFGAYSIIETNDGYLKSCQYTPEQMQYFKNLDDFWFERSDASNGKTLEFTTKATQFSFEYKISWIGSEDSIELLIDDLIMKVFYVKDLDKEGTLTFIMPDYNKKVVINLPTDATILLRNAQANGEVIPVLKKYKVLWMGDSITQGYGSFRSAHTYVNVLNRYCDYDIINQGLGGYVYDSKVLIPMKGYSPDKIVVALGANQYETDDFTEIEAYYHTLQQLYQNTPVLCLTPIYRGDSPNALTKLVNFSEKLKKICSKYPNIKIVDGLKLVPHTSEYFIDEVHPNELGAEIYGRNLVKAIQDLEF
jgi:lysophospholipase L1-like esterase